MSDNPYYPVTTSNDTTHLAEDEWGLTVPGVQYVRKVGRTKRARAIVDGLQSIPRCAVCIFLSVMVLVLVCIIIAVASNEDELRKPKWNEPMRQQKPMGLNFYPIPEDKSILIRFKDHKFRDDEAIKKSMDDVLKPYEHSHQLVEEHYAQCTESYTPTNMTCKFPLGNFGDECTKARDYGYGVNMPCVLLQLDLPTDKTIRRINEASKLWEKAKNVPAVVETEGDTSVVPVTCDASTPQDEIVLNKGDTVPYGGKRILYFPANNLPSFFYRQRDPHVDFIKPAVMIQLTSLVDLSLLHITCTIWGQVFNADKIMEDHDLLNTTFAVYIEG